MRKYRVRDRTLRGNKTERADFQKRPYRGDGVKSIYEGRLQKQEDISSSGAEESKNRENTFEGYIGKGS